MHKPGAFSCGMMALVGTLWGLHGPALKFAFAAGFTFPQLVVGEYLVGSLVFGAVVLARRDRPPAAPRFWGPLLLAALLGCGVPLFLFRAYQLGPVSIGATLLFLYVPFTQLLNALLVRRAPPRREIAAAALVVLGAALASDFLGAAGAADLRGAPSAILAALCFAGFFVTTARFGGEATPALRSLVCCLVACTLLLALSAPLGWSLIPASPSPARAALWVLALGVAGLVIPTFLLVRHGPRTGSGLGSILTSTELPVAVVVSAWALGDPISPLRILGVALVLVGIALPHATRLLSR